VSMKQLVGALRRAKVFGKETAADEARRQIERDLHDGIQQRLIALTFRARAMTQRPPDELPSMAAELAEGLKDASDELQEVSRGIHPTILTEAGLGPALRALARRCEIPVDLNVRLDKRLPAPIEAAACYIAFEALTNVDKHAHANVVELIAAHDIGVLTLEVRDESVGGVDAGRGSGILGLTDPSRRLARRSRLPAHRAAAPQSPSTFPTRHSTCVESRKAHRLPAHIEFARGDERSYRER
jgi:signal transduction histidine kinase